MMRKGWLFGGGGKEQGYDEVMKRKLGKMKGWFEQFLSNIYFYASLNFILTTKMKKPQVKWARHTQGNLLWFFVQYNGSLSTSCWFDWNVLCGSFPVDRRYLLTSGGCCCWYCIVPSLSRFFSVIYCQIGPFNNWYSCGVVVFSWFLRYWCICNGFICQGVFVG